MPYRFRSHHRFPVSLPLTYARGFHKGQGTVWNLSVVGWRILVKFQQRYQTRHGIWRKLL